MAKRASSGHKLGQLVGDWFEQYFSLPLLSQVANALELYLDNRFVTRSFAWQRKNYLARHGRQLGRL